MTHAAVTETVPVPPPVPPPDRATAPPEIARVIAGALSGLHVVDKRIVEITAHAVALGVTAEIVLIDFARLGPAPRMTVTLQVHTPAEQARREDGHDAQCWVRHAGCALHAARGKLLAAERTELAGRLLEQVEGAISRGEHDGQALGIAREVLAGNYGAGLGEVGA